MKYPKENNKIVKWNHQRNKWNSYQITLVIEWNSRWNCLANLWNCFEIAWQTYEKWKITQPLELWNKAYKEWDISLMHVVLCTFTCRHLPHFYHKSGYHQSQTHAQRDEITLPTTLFLELIVYWEVPILVSVDLQIRLCTN